MKTKLMLLFSYCQLGACDVQNIKCNILIGVLFGFVVFLCFIYITMLSLRKTD